MNMSRMTPGRFYRLLRDVYGRKSLLTCGVLAEGWAMGAGAIRWRRSRPDRACTSSWPRIRRRRTCLTALRNTSMASAESTPANHPMSAHRAGLQSLSTLRRGSAPGRFGTNGPTQQNPRPRE
jgi:hypothetical protein